MSTSSAPPVVLLGDSRLRQCSTEVQDVTEPQFLQEKVLLENALDDFRYNLIKYLNTFLFVITQSGRRMDLDGNYL